MYIIYTYIHTYIHIHIYIYIYIGLTLQPSARRHSATGAALFTELYRGRYTIYYVLTTSVLFSLNWVVRGFVVGEQCIYLYMYILYTYILPYIYKVGTGEQVRYVTRDTLHYFFVALFPLPSVSGYNLGAALNTNIGFTLPPSARRHSVISWPLQDIVMTNIVWCMT